ncbi:hypothetical protein [Bradyrhizobium sp. NP1]|uniref:hypothetical protein n=1 Tax=Bradyrhizobium sp. NP1 TaxID=3049772 RepID=UPI0025A624B5|nr:hypothetical protein [Bradyrhizobium sp. NP1]WJR80516.1 hypothetical protein QOU61_12380 [Bradyrhizobium sp. NP1]
MKPRSRNTFGARDAPGATGVFAWLGRQMAVDRANAATNRIIESFTFDKPGKLPL